MPIADSSEFYMAAPEDIVKGGFNCERQDPVVYVWGAVVGEAAKAQHTHVT